MASRDDIPRVFDISRPGRVSPDPSSRPVIAGHQPMMGDPMVRESYSPKVTNVPVSSAEPETPFPATLPEPQPNNPSPPAYTPLESLIPNNQPSPLPTSSGDDGSEHMVNSLPLSHPPGAGPRGRSPLVLLISSLIFLFALYAAVDALTNVNLPFHIFRKKTTLVQTPSQTQATPAAQPAPTTPSLPTGFSQYNLSNTPISFAYPAKWGAPSAVAEPGFSKRGGGNKSTGTYAYLINFATNKNVQVAITSSRYLPVARGTLYYDFLQGCIGTNDGKFYKSVLHFQTTGGVDTPTTVTCDQGPLTDATKLNDSTIVQLKTKDSHGLTILGDIYTENLNAVGLPVLRVKDAAMTNSADIKTLLGTVRVDASARQSP